MSLNDTYERLSHVNLIFPLMVANLCASAFSPTLSEFDFKISNFQPDRAMGTLRVDFIKFRQNLLLFSLRTLSFYRFKLLFKAGRHAKAGRFPEGVH